jgi:hypothetical protein
MRLFPLVLTACSVLSADTIYFDYETLGSYRAEGLLSLRDIGTWNGQPITDTNKPSNDQRELAATTNFYASSSASNELLVQITNVITTQGSFWSGQAFVNTALTDVEFWLPGIGGTVFGTPAFSSDFANPGQRIMGPVEAVQRLCKIHLDIISTRRHPMELIPSTHRVIPTTLRLVNGGLSTAVGASLAAACSA